MLTSLRCCCATPGVPTPKPRSRRRCAAMERMAGSDCTATGIAALPQAPSSPSSSPSSSSSAAAPRGCWCSCVAACCAAASSVGAPLSLLSRFSPLPPVARVRACMGSVGGGHAQCSSTQSERTNQHGSKSNNIEGQQRKKRRRRRTLYVYMRVCLCVEQCFRKINQGAPQPHQFFLLASSQRDCKTLLRPFTHRAHAKHCTSVPDFKAV